MYVKKIWSAVLFLMLGITSSDPDNVRDYCPAIPSEKQKVFINGLPCKSPPTIVPADFKSSKLAQRGDTESFERSSVTIASASEFPGLNTLGLSIARTDLDTDGLVMPHSHPRATEMFYVENGTVLAGFVDPKNNKVFQEVLGPGGVMVFPRGLLHFCVNVGFGPATSFSMLNAQNPGVVSVAGAMFESSNELVSILKRAMLRRNVTMVKFPSVKISR